MGDIYLLRDVPIGRNLRQIRKKAKLTQKEVAEKLQTMGRTTMCREKISQIEREARNIPVSLLRDLKEVYGLEHYDDFFAPPSPESDSSKNKKSENLDNQTIWKQSNASCIKKKS